MSCLWLFPKSNKLRPRNRPKRRLLNPKNPAKKKKLPLSKLNLKRERAQRFLWTKKKKRSPRKLPKSPKHKMELFERHQSIKRKRRLLNLLKNPVRKNNPKRLLKPSHLPLKQLLLKKKLFNNQVKRAQNNNNLKKARKLLPLKNPSKSKNLVNKALKNKWNLKKERSLNPHYKLLNLPKPLMVNLKRSFNPRALNNNKVLKKPPKHPRK